MSEGGENPVAPSPVCPHPILAADGWVGASVLLTAAACWLALYAGWEVECSYAQRRGRDELDMPDWFVINTSLLFAVWTYTAIIGFCQFVAAGLFFTWARRAGWIMRVGFVAQWLGSSGLLVMLLRPWV